MDNAKLRSAFLPVAAATFILLATAFLFSASANEELTTREKKDILFIKGHHRNMQAMREVIENGNYEAWKSLAKDSPIGGKNLELINEDAFQKLQEAHKLIESGDKEGAKKIMKELGIKFPHGPMPFRNFIKGKKFMHKLSEEERNTIESAMELEDFEAWKSAMEKIDPAHPVRMTREHFEKMLEARGKMQGGMMEKLMRQGLSDKQRAEFGSATREERRNLLEKWGIKPIEHGSRVPKFKSMGQGKIPE